MRKKRRHKTNVRAATYPASWQWRDWSASAQGERRQHPSSASCERGRNPGDALSRAEAARAHVPRCSRRPSGCESAHARACAHCRPQLVAQKAGPTGRAIRRREMRSNAHETSHGACVEGSCFAAATANERPLITYVSAPSRRIRSTSPRQDAASRRAVAGRVRRRFLPAAAAVAPQRSAPRLRRRRAPRGASLPRARARRHATRCAARRARIGAPAAARRAALAAVAQPLGAAR